MYKDKTITCRDCGKDFEFTASEQEFYAEKGFTNEPGRCPECRAARKRQSRGSNNRGRHGGQRQMYPATCSECGKETQVPFKPSGDKPVYCNDCFQSKKRSQW
ncbi:zinc-ribbon domain containing protein [Clostridium sp. 'deep sea']|uniref:zinc-ribbon domain containing protein n=1 Tax=Clostridium sp. 'deep sea' TaxID=2779445 RepID=UPI0018965CC0|nr:zinc-ribbon domain containing protein [Clostridium sp. 'deep sea']QOR35996.1 zinc-ribbon domain containing protein [Clostridium sp. 'deep sea']